MKPAELREMTLEDARAKEGELTKELFSLRMRHATNQLENPLRLRALRRDIARVKTILAEKERGAKK
ncbi:MAG: 50S ribosomal protein L29 [Thermodesulfobacteriota bacterium]|nr:MAG: 50S ribosomal protein L29 [Thermodesulfobacteriota bacterium]